LQFPIYLDYAATTPLHPDVLEAMLPYLKENYGNSGSSHHLYGWKAAEAIDSARINISSYFKLTPSSLIFTSGATESNNLAIQGFLATVEKGHLITSSIEHKAVLEVFKHYERCGWEVTYLKPNHLGEISEESLKDSIRPNTKLVSLMWVNNEIGTILNLAQVTALCKENQLIFHSDITQGLGKIELDTDFMPDLMSFSGHKIYAPKGIGGLIINNKTIQLKPLVFGGTQERGLRAGTLPTHLIVALSKAFQLLPDYLNIQHNFVNWKSQIIQNLCENLSDRIILNSAIEHSIPQIVHFSVRGIDWEELFRSLSKLALSNGSACNVKSQLPSHVMLELGHDANLSLSSVRLSLGIFTTQEEIDFVLGYLIQQLNK
jgi:cysteine desulfurase